MFDNELKEEEISCPKKADDILESKFGWKETGCSVLVFVHGFNTSLDSAIDTMDSVYEKITTDEILPTETKRKFKTVIFDWPSTYKSQANLAFNYAKDCDTVHSNIRHFVWV